MSGVTLVVPLNSSENYSCRLCLHCSESNVDIFGPTGQNDTLDGKISKYLYIKIFPSDGLPKRICLQCQEALNVFHSFSIKANSVQEQLLQMLKDANNVPLHTEPEHVVNIVPNEEEQKIVSLENAQPVRRSRRRKARRKSYQSLESEHLKPEPTDKNMSGTSVGIGGAVFNDSPIAHDETAFLKDSDLSSLEDQEWVFPDFNFESDGSNDSCNDGTWKPSNLNGRSKRKRASRKSQDDDESTQPRRTSKTKRSKKDLDCIDDYDDESQDDPGKERNSHRKLRITATHGTMPKPKLPPGSRKVVRARMNAMMVQFYGITCDICVNNSDKIQASTEPAKFQTFEALCEHMETEHNERGYVKCCNCTMRERKRAERHMLLHTQPGSVYKCNICGKQLSSQQSFRCHILLHLPDSERPYQCQHCDRGFVTKSDLVQHEHQHLPEDKRFSYTCDICGSRFSYESGLMIHKQRVHENMRTHLCDICAKIFNSRCDMERHREQIHGNVKRELCPDCGKWFKGPSILKTHMRQHRGVLYECQFCDKKYTVRSSWKAHLLRHSDEKPHKCPMCEKTFKLPGTLKMHLNQHTGELPYSCPFCPKKFASSGNYYTHRKRMHREEVAEMKKATEASLAASGLLPPATVPPPTVTRSITEAIAHAKAKAAANPLPPGPTPGRPQPPPAIAPAPATALAPASVAFPLPTAADLVADTQLVQATGVVSSPAVVPRSTALQHHQIGLSLASHAQPQGDSNAGTVIPTLVVTGVGHMSPSGSITTIPMSQVVTSLSSANTTLPDLGGNVRILAPGFRVLHSEALYPLSVQMRPVCGKTDGIVDVLKPVEVITTAPLDCKTDCDDMQTVQEV